MPGARLSLVAAAAENNVIGRSGGLPWRLPSDLALFRRLTLGRPLIMGRRTFEAIGRPLAGRDNIVLSRSPAALPAGCSRAPSLEAALALAVALAVARGVGEVMIIGGAGLYRATLPLAHRIYLTRVHATLEGDTWLPPIDAADWRETERQPIARSPGDEYEATLIVLERVSPSVSQRP